MATKKKTTTKKAATVGTTTASFEWGVVFAGAVVAAAVSIILAQFGTVIGLASDQPLSDDVELARWGVITIGLWLLWIALLASLAGGYVAGYMRAPVAGIKAHERETRDGIYGLTTWATGTVAVAIVGALGAAFSATTDLEVELTDQFTDMDQNIAVIYAFGAGATSLLSAVAAWWAATMGGYHRDKGTNFSKYISFR